MHPIHILARIVRRHRGRCKRDVQCYFRRTLHIKNCCRAVLRIRDVYPGSRILIFTHPGSRISDPGSKNSSKREGWKNFFVKPFFVATNFATLNIILFLICWRKKFGPIFQELFKFLPKKLSPSPQKYGFGIRDPRAGIRKKPIPDPGSRGQKGSDPGSGSATLLSSHHIKNVAQLNSFISIKHV